MALQEEQPKCRNGRNIGGKKKNKRKKLRRRGLGVARLEKLRMEKQRKNGAPSSSNALQSMTPFFPFSTATNDPNPMLRPVVNHDPLFRHSESSLIQTNCFNTTLPLLLENSVVGPSPINSEALARSFGCRTPLSGDSPIPGWQSSGLQLSPTSVVNKVLPPSSSANGTQQLREDFK